MFCENCKERPASVIVTKGYMGESVEHNLCEKCAFHSETLPLGMQDEQLSIQQFLSHWFGEMDAFQPEPKKEKNKVEQFACATCQLTYQKFLDVGKFGCSNCYETFKKSIPHVLGKLHSGKSKHIGKVPASFNQLYAIKRKIEEIREKMQEAVEAERFEDAALLRDEANRLQKVLDDGGGSFHVD